MEETKITLTEYLESQKLKTSAPFSRKYVPLEEKQDIINLALTMIFGKFEDGDLVEADAYQEPDSLVDEMFINTSIIRAYTGIEEKNRVLIYDAFMQDGLYEELLDLIPDARNFDRIFSFRISEKREYIKENYMNAQSSTLTTLVSELVQKQIDNQELQKIVLEQQKALNDIMPPEEQKAFATKLMESGFTGESVVKAYMESDEHKSKEQEIIDVKNKQISELKQELKNVTGLIQSIPTDHKKAKKATTKSKVVNIDKTTDEA